MSTFDVVAHQRERIRGVETSVTALRAEERRLYRLLGLSLQVATKDGQECKPAVLLELLCALDGSDPARPAWVEEAERATSDEETNRLVQLLRETDPDLIMGRRNAA